MSETRRNYKDTVLNINPGRNKKLLENCRLLKEYMLYVTKVRENLKIMDVDSAVEKAVDDIIKLTGCTPEMLIKVRKLMNL